MNYVIPRLAPRPPVVRKCVLRAPGLHFVSSTPLYDEVGVHGMLYVAASSITKYMHARMNTVAVRTHIGVR